MVYDLDGEVWVILGEGEVIIRLAASKAPDETLTYIGPAERYKPGLRIPGKGIARPENSR